MKRFVRFESSDGIGAVYLNVDRVVGLQVQNETETNVKMSDGHFWGVMGGIAKVANLLNGDPSPG